MRPRLDINNMNLGLEQITVQGQGVNNFGAIVNNNTAVSTAPQQALRFVTLTGDTTFGGVKATPAPPTPAVGISVAPLRRRPP